MHRIIAGALLLVTAPLAAFATEVPPPPEGAPAYVATPGERDGQYLALSIEKLQHGFDPPRPFLIWAIGSSYTNKLGSGEELIAQLRAMYPAGPEMVYKKMVGNSVPWQYLRGWARHLVIPQQPDLVIVYTLGNPHDLDLLIAELRRATTADIIVPSLHWRIPDERYWASPEENDDPTWRQVRELCARQGVQFVENRRDWGNYLRENHLPLSSLLADAVHQSEYGAHVIRTNIAQHLRPRDTFAYRPRERERRIELEAPPQGTRVQADERWTAEGGVLRTDRRGAELEVDFIGRRIDLIATCSSSAGSLRAFIDGHYAPDTGVYLATYIQPHEDNFVDRAEKSDPPRDKSPHGVRLGENIVPQEWTIVMTSDMGDYQLTGSVTGPDGAGNSSQPFVSKSGQIEIDPLEWRRPERNRAGDRFTFSVYSAAHGHIALAGTDGEPLRVTIAQQLPPGKHTLRLVASGDGAVAIKAVDVFQPPLE